MKTQLEILSFIFDKMVFWILFAWNILLAAFLIFLACEKKEKSAEASGDARGTKESFPDIDKVLIEEMLSSC